MFLSHHQNPLTPPGADEDSEVEKETVDEDTEEVAEQDSRPQPQNKRSLVLANDAIKCMVANATG